MKVLHLLKTSKGAAWALRLMRELVKHGVEVHVALPKGGQLYNSYEAAGICIHPMNFSLKGMGKSLKSLRKIVDEVSPDLIHSHFVLTTLIMRLGLRSYNIPRVFEVPGPLHLEHLLTRLVDIKTADKHDFWIPTCKWSYDQYVKSGISEDKLFLTYYGGDINYTEHKTGVLRKDYNISNDKYIVAMVAYMYAPKKWLGQKRGIKGHEDFIDAVSLLQKKYPQIQGVCIGGAWDGAVEYEKSVRAYSESVGANIIFTGTRKDVGDLYQDINCVVHPSHSENLGGAGESLLLGVPTIASSVGGFPDIVINNRTGLLVPAKSPSAIAKAIETMLLSPERARAMAIEGQKYVNELLDVKNTSKSVFDFYCKIVEMYENL